MKNLIKNLVAIGLISLGSNLYSGTIDPYTPDEKYIEYGNQFECVLEIMGSYEHNKQLFSASCVAIDKNWILTAAHVVKGARFAFIYHEKDKRCIIIEEIICSTEFEEKKLNKIDYISDSLLMCSPSIMSKTELEFLIASGDSGGGLFIDNKLAGINSCVMAVDKKPDSTYNDESGHTRVSKFLGWIKEHMQKRREQAQGLLP